MSETLLHDLPWARLLAGNNELKLRAKTAAEGGPESADALMLRFQVPEENLKQSGWIGCIAADVIRSGVERVQLKLGLKLDPGPVLECYATRPGSAGIEADEILGATPPPDPDRAAAADFLTQLLADGPMRSEEVYAAGRMHNYSPSTLNRAKRRAGVRSYKEGFVPSEWFWERVAK